MVWLPGRPSRAFALLLLVGATFAPAATGVARNPSGLPLPQLRTGARAPAPPPP